MMESKSSTTTEAKLIASDGDSGDNFGYSVSISGDVAMVGAPLDTDSSDRTGAVYVYTLVGDPLAAGSSRR